MNEQHREHVTFKDDSTPPRYWSVETTGIGYPDAIRHARVMLRAYLVRLGPIPKLEAVAYGAGREPERAAIVEHVR